MEDSGGSRGEVRVAQPPLSRRYKHFDNCFDEVRKKWKSFFAHNASIFFFRVFLSFKRINRVSRFIGFERSLTIMLVIHQYKKGFEAFTKFPIIFPVASHASA